MSETTERFVINGDGTVTDTSTGLMWQQETAGKMEWKSAVDYCKSLTLAGYTDWRLPSIKEIQSVIDYEPCEPVIDCAVLSDVRPHCYWSSDIDTNRPNYAKYLDFTYYCSVDYHHKCYPYYVKAVRGRKEK